jgi:hypothetical protein
MVHFHDRGNALGSAQPQQRNVRRCGNGIAVERYHPEDMARQSKAADFSGAGVDDMEQHPLALFHADGFAVTSHATVDAKQLVAYFEAFRFHSRFLVGFLPHLLQGGKGLPASASCAMSPPRLKDGKNSFITRKTSRS